MQTLFEHPDGEEALHRLEQIFYDSVLADPLLHGSDHELHPLRDEEAV